MTSRSCHPDCGPSQPAFDATGEGQRFSRADIVQELERVCASDLFRRSERQKRFLIYVVEQTLSGNPDSIKEPVLALEVFDRPSDYDPKVDTIVRVEARRLRSKLVEYYAGAGANDPIRIDLPVGSYVPVFQPGPPLETPPALGEPASAAAPATASAGTQRPRRWPLWAAAAAGVVVVSAAVAGVWFYRAAGPKTPLRVAVLPFQNLNSQPEDEIYSDGVTETLTTDLAKIRGLQVISRTSVGRYKNTRQPLPQIARELGANYIVEGSFQRHGDQCRITAQLIRTSDDVHVWAEAYDLSFTDILRVERRAAASIVRSVHVFLDPGERQALERQPTQSAEAYDALLKARKISNEYLFLAKQDYYDDAAGLLDRALELDPGYVDAVVERALLDGRKFQNTAEVPSRDRAEQGFRRALSLEPCQPVANAIMANISNDRGDLDEAVRYGRQAVDCSPHSSQAHNSLGRTYLALGFFEAAVEELRESAAADPLFVSPHLNLSGLLLRLNRKRDAIAEAKRATEIEPQSAVALAALGAAWLDNGNPAEARSTWEKAASFAPPAQSAGVRELFQALELAAGGQIDYGRQMIRRHRADAWLQGVLWNALYSRLVMDCEEPAEVVAMIQRSPFMQSYRTLISLPAAARLRSHPAFRDLLRQRYQVWQNHVARYGPTISPPPPKLPAPDVVIGIRSSPDSRLQEAQLRRLQLHWTR